MAPSDQPRRIRLRFAGRCHVCATALAADTWAVRVPAGRVIECLSCAAVRPRAALADVPATARPAGTAGDAATVGAAGASARREHERRRQRREHRILAAHPRSGARLLAMTDEPHAIRAWAIGARGERQLGRALDALTGHGVRVLHDRRVPRSRANIDHIAVAPSGVHVIDAKRYGGRVRRHVLAGSGVERLLVDTRDCTELVAGVHWQVDVVRRVAGHGGVPVTGALCFVDADWPADGSAFTIGGVHVVSPARAAAMLTAPGPLGDAEVRALHGLLAAALDAA